MCNVRTFNNVDSLCRALEESPCDLLISDFFLGKNMTFADILSTNVKLSQLPTLIVSSFYDRLLIEQIEKVRQVQFLCKDSSTIDYKKAIAYTLNEGLNSQVSIDNEPSQVDFVFVKSGSKLKKIEIHDIWHIVVSGNYLDVYYGNRRKVALRSTLNDFLRKLPDQFIKANQGEVINIKYITEIDLKNSSILLKNDIEVPLSRKHRKMFLAKYQLK